MSSTHYSRRPLEVTQPPVARETVPQQCKRETLTLKKKLLRFHYIHLILDCHRDRLMSKMKDKLMSHG